MLKVNALHTYYGKIHALKGVDIAVDEGEIVTLIGSNGAGKSTLLSTITGIVPAAKGTVEFEGHSITNLAPHRIVERGISLSPEGREVFPALSVQENLRLGAYSRKEKGRIEESYARVYDLSPASKNASARVPAPFPAANNRCLPSAGR